MEFHFCFLTCLEWYGFLAVADVHLAVLIAVYLLLMCILECPLLCVVSVFIFMPGILLCLFSSWFCCDNWPAMSRVGLGMHNITFCIGGSLVVCIEVSAIMWLCSSWILLLVAVICNDTCLWQSNNGKISLVNVVSLMHLSISLCPSPQLIGLCWWTQLVLGCWC